MKRKPRPKKEMLLPSSLIEDIEYDELDKKCNQSTFKKIMSQK